MKRLRRALYVLAASLIATALALAMRALIATGLFVTVAPHSYGSCERVAGAARDVALDLKDGLVFASSGSGLFVAHLDRIQDGFVRLRGTPAHIDPYGLGLYRPDNGSAVLMTIDRRGQEPAVDTFDLRGADGVITLTERSRITSGLLSDPSGVVPIGPDAFYVTNASTSRTSLGRFLEAFALVPRGNVVFFDGTFFRKVVEGFAGASGIESSDDLGRLYVGTRLGRTLYALERNPFNGNLKEIGELRMGVAVEGIRRDAKGDLWVAGHPDSIEGWSPKRPSEIYRVSLQAGVPRNAELVYANPGPARTATVAAPIDDGLLMGAPTSATLFCRAAQKNRAPLRAP